MTDRHEGPIGCRKENSLSAPDDPIALACEDPLNLEDIPFLRRLQEERPVVAIRTPTGDKAWLITRYDEVRALLMDRRLGRAHPDPANAPKLYAGPMMEKMVSVDFDNECEIRANRRAMLATFFTPRKMQAFRPRLAPLVAEAVARFAGQRPPADVHELSETLTVQMLGELIGLPREDRANLAQLAYQTANLADPQSAASGQDALTCLMRAAAAQKRAEPGDDIMSDIVRKGFTDDQAAELGVVLVFAGMSPSTNTTSIIAWIASDLELRDRLIANPELMDSAVDELLRITGSGGFFPRYAREDIEIADVTIRAGDLVVVSHALANSDKRVFTNPYELDITRSPNPHLAFSHGHYYCPGAPLAKIQLVMTLNALLAALPTLRVANPLEGMVRDPEFLVVGVEKLLLTW
jgi:cytochrome P450